MNPRYIDELSWRFSEVYESVVDQIIINLARHFKFYTESGKLPGSWEYQIKKLAEMGQVTRETEQIILSMLGDADGALRDVLEAAILDGLKDAEPELRKAAMAGLLNGGSVPPPLAPNQMQAFKAYYAQSADKLNLVNTVMLESTQWAYAATVADIAARMEAAQGILNVATGEVVTGVSSMNEAIRRGVKKMCDNGITGFIDHGGHHWSPEAYVAMDVRTTMANTARAAVWERMDEYGDDLFQVSWHNGARPLCYDWQGRVISRTDTVREVEDGDGNAVHVWALSETTYGEPAGLFGINCGHYQIPFTPGFSSIRKPMQDAEENAKAYEESQHQRLLERKLRNEKRDLEVLKAQGASEDMLKEQRARVRKASKDIDTFCDETGRTRRRDRETAPVRATFPTENGAVEKFRDEYIKTDAPEKWTVKTSAPSASTNIFGETIQFSEKMNKPKWDESKQIITNLASEYKTKLKTVDPGAHQSAGDVQISGTVMKLSSSTPETAIHEFAHSISMERQTKYGLYDESDFWKEIRKTRTSYMKAVADKPQSWISAYEHSSGSVDEFMADAFTLGYMRSKGIAIPEKYGNDTVYSDLVLEIVRKYFGK